MAGIQTKLLMQPGVEKHLGDFGVDPESASHTQINQLCGGMKVKVVLAAETWQNSHVLIFENWLHAIRTLLPSKFYMNICAARTGLMHPMRPEETVACLTSSTGTLQRQ